MAALGESFRAAREAQGLSLSDVADRIHIRAMYLNAIETEDWAAIGPLVYVRGFVRSYARCLGLDADEAVAQVGVLAGSAAGSSLLRSEPVLAGRPQRNESGAGRLRGEARRPGLSLGAIAGLAVAVLLVLFAGYELYDYLRTRSVADSPPAAAATSVDPAAVTASAPPVPVATTATRAVEHSSGLALHLRDSSWLKVVVDGKVAMEGTFAKGTERSFAGRSATIRAGNAGGVDVKIDGKEQGPMGGLGDVAERSFQL